VYAGLAAMHGRPRAITPQHHPVAFIYTHVNLPIYENLKLSIWINWGCVVHFITEIELILSTR